MPLLEGVRASFGVVPEAVLADAGDRNEADFVSLGREGKACVSADPHRCPATRRMADKLGGAVGRACYSRRKWLSEGPNGWITEILGFRRFSVRGAEKVRGEWHLVCLALNIKRLGGLAAC